VAPDVGLGVGGFLSGAAPQDYHEVAPVRQAPGQGGQDRHPRRARSAATGVVRAGWPKKVNQETSRVVCSVDDIPTGRLPQVFHNPFHALLFYPP